MSIHPTWTKRLILSLIAITVIQLAISIPHQHVQGDEAWLGEQAYFVAHEGVMRSELFTGYALQHERILVTHKLFILLGGAAVWLFGWDILSLRILSILSGLLALALVYFELRRSEPQPLARWIGVFALIASPLFFKFINIYRPEVMLAATGLASYVCLARYLSTKYRMWLILSAVLGGLAVLVHVNGMIYTAAALVVLALHRRFWGMGIYAIVAVGIGALYFLDVVGHWDMLIFQLQQVPSLTADDFRWDTPVWRLLDEHKRLFRKPEIIFTSILFFVSFGYSWKHRPANRRSLLAYAIVIMLGLGAVAQAKTTPYAIALLPFFALVIAQATTHWLENRHALQRWLTPVVAIVWGAFIVHGLIDNTRSALTGKENIAEHNRTIAVAIPKGAVVLAPMTFIFNEIDQFELRAVMAAELQIAGHHDAALSIDQIMEYADVRNITAYVFNPEQRERFGLADAVVGHRYAGFVIVLITTDGSVVLVKNSRSVYSLADDA